MHIQVKNLSFAYRIPGYSSKPALKGISLEIHPGEIVGIIGLSGSGKSTLMRHLTGLLKPDKGEIYVDGENIWQKNFDLTKIRQKIGLVFQFPEKQLFKETVFDDIAVAPGNMNLDDEQILSRVNSAMTAVGLDIPKYKDKSPLNLSQGEKRRVAIAGILALNPDCFIMDEPTAGVDANGVKLIKKLIGEFRTAEKTTVIISHNIDFVLSVVSRIIILHAGEIYFDGAKGGLLENAHILTRIGFPTPRIFKLNQYLQNAGHLKNEAYFDPEKIKEKIIV